MAMRSTENIKGVAGRAAVWSARHRSLAIVGWLVFVIAVTVLSGQLGTHKATAIQLGHGDSGQAEKIIDQAGFPITPAGEAVIVRGADRAATVTDLTKSLRAAGFKPDAAAVQSADGRATLVTFTVPGDPETAGDRVGPALDTVAKVQGRHPGLYVAESGAASSDKLIGDALDTGLTRLGLLSIPVTLGILLVAFGAIVAALVPVALAVTAVVAALGLLAAASRFAPTVDTTTDVMLLVGLAVGVDYCLFYIRRERDERRAGADAHRALVIAAQTSGRSIWVSGLTTTVAMAGMFLTRDATFASFAVGTILVVATAMLGSLTVLPALLSTLGDRIEAGRIRRRPRAHRSSGGIWTFAVRRPLLSTIVALAALAVLITPVFGLKTKGEGIEDLSPKQPIAQAAAAIEKSFPGSATPASIVVRAPTVRGHAFETAYHSFQKRLGTTDTQIKINPAGTVAVIEADLPSGTPAAAVAALRKQILPPTLGALPGATVLVSGEAAQTVDFNQRLDDSLPWVFGFVLGLAFLLLLVSFRSVVVAVTGVLLNLLSVAAAYGMLVFVFQKGHFASLLDFKPSGAITDWMPLFLFIILFGLSMDYHVFVLSRIREGYDRGLPTRAAVADGIGRTAGVITSAAVVMVAVFSLFATLPLISTKELGVGLAAAVLLDATVIRGVLLPAVMALLGEANWYLPKWLTWLPKIDHEPAPVVEPERELILTA
jgi:RND superfamily putative drug exporter